MADKGYLHWLIGLTTNGKKSQHVQLLTHLHAIPYSWSVPNDDNRDLDGRHLRVEYVTTQTSQPWDPHHLDAPASMLEMIIALSRRVADLQYVPGTSATSAVWFWTLMMNIHLDPDVLTDANWESIGSDRASDLVMFTCQRVINRTYGPDGSGGLFPLHKPHILDQRRVELWYQMQYYLEFM